MNLFFLDIDPRKCAQYHCNKHVIKMILEIVQMLYTAHNVLKTQDLPSDSYRSFSMNHPTCIWIRQCVQNYKYASDLAECLCEEYNYRYNKTHNCEKHVRWLKNNLPRFGEKLEYKNNTILSYNKKLQEIGCTPVPLAMYDDVKFNDTFKSYRFYYIVHKRGFAKWKNRDDLTKFIYVYTFVCLKHN